MENRIFRQQEYNSFWITEHKTSFEICGNDNYQQSGYTIHYHPDLSETFIVWDFTNEIERISCNKGLRIEERCFDLGIEYKHFKIEEYLNENKELLPKMEDFFALRRFTDFITTVGYFFNDPIEKLKMQRVAWAFERKENLLEKPIKESSDFIKYYTAQKQIAQSVSKVNDLPNEICLIGGADVAYDDQTQEMVGAIVVINVETFEVIEQAFHKMKINFPYIPGLFSFRETPPLIEAFKKLSHKPDLIICDGHGIAHPKAAGMASHLGVELNIPTIGCAKKRLIGFYEKEKLNPARGSMEDLIWNSMMIGKVLRTQHNIKPVFVSIGHKVTLDTATNWVLKMAPKFRLPDTTRFADQLVNSLLKNKTEIDPYHDECD